MEQKSLKSLNLDLAPLLSLVLPKRVREVQLYAARSNGLSRIGARWYGLTWDNTPLLALYVDDAFYEPARSVGLAVGPLEVGVFMSYRSQSPANAEPAASADPVAGA